MAKHHPNKEVSDAMESALSLGWRFIKGSGHVYGTLHARKPIERAAKFESFQRLRIQAIMHGPSAAK